MSSTFDFGSWQGALYSAVQTTLVRFVLFLPTLLAAFVLFLIGLLLGGWGKKLTIRLLESIRLSTLVKSSGFGRFLEKAEVTVKAEEIMGGIVRWLVVLVFFVASVNVLGLTTVNKILDSILAYIPNVFSAIIILAAGLLMAGLVESLIKGALFNIDVKAARLLAKIGSYLVVIFAALTAVNELGIAQVLVNTLFIGLVAMLALGFGLAIGLGSKDLVAKLLADWYESLRQELSQGGPRRKK